MSIIDPSLCQVHYGECFIDASGIQKLMVYTGIKNGIQEMQEYPLTNNTGIVLRCRMTGRGEFLERERYLQFTKAYFHLKASNSSYHANSQKILDVVFIEPSDSCRIFYGNCNLLFNATTKVINSVLSYTKKHELMPITDIQNGDTLIMVCTEAPGFVIHRDIVLDEKFFIKNQLVNRQKFPYEGKLLFPNGVDPTIWIEQWSSSSICFVGLLLRNVIEHEKLSIPN